MLVLSRRVGEQFVVPQCQLTVTVLEATAGRVRLGITAPADVVVHRREVCEQIHRQGAIDAGKTVESLRILVADRDEFLVAAYREHLSRLGATVATAGTGLDCWERLRSFRPDVLVLDPAIPWGGGDGVLAVLHEEPSFRPASVLLLTQGGSRSLLYHLSSFRVDDYQAKPLSPRRLIERIAILRAAPDRLAEANPNVAFPATPPPSPSY
jgi:carbon storage regulator